VNRHGHVQLRQKFVNAAHFRAVHGDREFDLTQTQRAALHALAHLVDAAGLRDVRRRETNIAARMLCHRFLRTRIRRGRHQQIRHRHAAALDVFEVAVVPFEVKMHVENRAAPLAGGLCAQKA